MILTSTSEILQVVLSNTVATRQMDFYCSYNNITSTTLTPVKNQGTTNNSTVVTLMPVPGSNQQNQLRHLSVYNCDTSGNTVTIQFSGASGVRRVLTTYLFVGESIQFTPSNGWQSLTHNGIVKTYNTAQNPSPIKTPAYFSAVSGGLGSNITSGTAYAVYLGKADRPYTQVTIQPNVTTVLGATITFAEAAIYKGYPTIGSNLTLTFCGFRDCSGSNQSGFGGTAISKTIPIIVSGITTGDDIWAVISTVTSGTNLAIRGVNYDLLGSGFFQSATGSIRPSTATTISFTTVTTDTRTPYIPWQGFQW
jgi:hypothetical protein